MLTLTNAQKKAGDKVSFVTFKGRPFTEELKDLGWQVDPIRVRTKIDPFAISQMIKLFRKEAPDIVHTHLSTSSVNGTLAARIAKVPCVSTVHGMSGKLSYIFADHMIGVSRGVCEHLVAQGIDPKKVTPVYNGVELPADVLSKEEARERFSLPYQATIVGTVSRLTSMKGIDFGLEAFNTISSKFPAIHYALVGDGDDRKRYEAWVKERGLEEKVHFLGYQDQVFDPISAMDLFLFPSLKEAMGIAVVEGMIMGLPVVSTNVGGLPEVIDSSVGRLVNPSDSAALAQAAIEIIEKNLIHELGSNAKNRAETMFSVESQRAGTQKVYEKLIRK
jgi:glycosyltransferase involved in cell wall biosynthesis